MAGVTLKEITKVYAKDHAPAVDKFNLQIADKEFIVLVGPSGCGKSTTLRMIAGLEDITSGELYFDDKMVNSLPPMDRDIAMVFQNYALYPHMTVYENMAFALKLKKYSKKEIEQRVMDAAKILGIESYLNRKPKALSGGQRQRVAIGRAIVRHPKVFLMDEPLSNLDAKLRNQMRSELIKLHKRLKTTFIYVTHDQIEAMTLGTRIVVMKDGLIQQVDAPQIIFDSPANMFIAGFIGMPQMNFFDCGKLLFEDHKYILELFGTKIILPDSKQQILNSKKIKPMNVVAGVRPEDVKVLSGEQNAIAARVDVSELMGSETYLHVDIQGEEAVLVVPTNSVSNRIEQIDISFNENKIHLFDPDTEKNLFV